METIAIILLVGGFGLVIYGIISLALALAELDSKLKG